MHSIQRESNGRSVEVFGFFFPFLLTFLSNLMCEFLCFFFLFCLNKPCVKIGETEGKDTAVTVMFHWL